MDNCINCIINAQKKDTYATIDTDSEDKDTYLKLFANSIEPSANPLSTLTIIPYEYGPFSFYQHHE